jgi:pilus assembly protein CpaF
MAEQAFHDIDDPADLPLFTQVLSAPPGRVRSTFLMRNDPVASREDLTEVVSPPDTFRITTAPQGWGQPRAGRRLRIGMDWSLVARLRAQASERLSASLGEEPGHLNREAQQELGRSIILDLLQTEAQQHLSTGFGSWSTLEQDAVAKAVFDALFGLGRLQPLVDDDRIENIIITRP